MSYPSNSNGGLPNWLDETSYGDTSKWKSNRWRWEFTRRRPDVRAWFVEHAENSRQLAIAIATQRDDGGRILQIDEPGFVAQLTIEKGRELGLSALPNPAISEQPFYVIWFHDDEIHFCIGRGIGFPNGDTAEHVEVPEGWLAAIMDLSKPWSTQGKVIERFFKAHQSMKVGEVTRPRQHPRNWLRYLRVLDGREAGASWSDLAEVAQSHGGDASPQNAKQVWEAARSLMFKRPT